MTSASKVTLRALEPEDLELVYQIENDTSLWAWGSTTVPLSRYLIRQYLEGQKGDIYADGQLRQTILCDGQPVGIVDLTAFEPHHRRAEVGIVVLPRARRQGIATAALRLLCDYAVRHLRLRTLYAYVAEDNQPAQALFRSLGYQPTGQLQRWIEGETPATLFQILL